ncbi:MAG: hypothetical protein U1F83_16475 [Verrucomicrobiota bacterium]
MPMAFCTAFAGNGANPAGCSANTAWFKAQGFSVSGMTPAVSQMELSTIRCHRGRSRSWLRDGTLLADDIYLQGKLVNAGMRGGHQGQITSELGRATRKVLKPVSEQHIHQVFIAAQLARPNGREAREWLQQKTSGKALGRFKRP